jgi:hypothetical protein
LRRVRLKRHDVLQEPHCPLRKVYFIESGVATMFAHTKHGGQVEVGIVGRFGLIGRRRLLPSPPRPTPTELRLSSPR